MIKIMVKLFGKIVGVVCVIVLVVLACSPEARTELGIVFKVATGQSVAALEDKLDQGTLALQRFDTEYVKAEQKLVALKHLQLDAKLCLRRAQEKATDYRNQGKEELALRNDEQAAFYENQLVGYEKSIESRTNKLQELRTIRERAREDVRLARERIAMLKATRDALDDAEQEEMLEKANKNVQNLQSHCNKLSAEIDILNIED